METQKRPDADCSPFQASTGGRVSSGLGKGTGALPDLGSRGCGVLGLEALCISGWGKCSATQTPAMKLSPSDLAP